MTTQSRSQEIIDKHIVALEEEVEWYQQKNIEWQKKYEEIENVDLVDTNNMLRDTIGKWKKVNDNLRNELQSLQDAVARKQELHETELVAENARLRGELEKYEQQHPYQNYVNLFAENKRLREQLRWHPVTELPEKETANCSINVILEIENVGVFKAYYNYLTDVWVCYQGDKHYFRSKDLKNTKSRWKYIPEDKDGDQ